MRCQILEIQHMRHSCQLHTALVLLARGGGEGGMGWAQQYCPAILATQFRAPARLWIFLRALLSSASWCQFCRDSEHQNL